MGQFDPFPSLLIHHHAIQDHMLGFAVAYAFAVAALLSNRFDAAWAHGRALDLQPGCSHHRHHAGQLVGLLRTGLGRLVVSGTNAFDFMPLAGTALIHSLAVADKRERVQGLDGAAGHAAFSLSLLEHAFLDAFGRADQRARFRPPTRRAAASSLISGHRGGRLAGLYGGPPAAVGLQNASTGVAQNRCCWQQRAAGRQLRRGDAWARCTPHWRWTPWDWARSPSARPASKPCSCRWYLVVLLMGIGPLARWKRASGVDLAQRLKWPALASVLRPCCLALAAKRSSAVRHRLRPISCVPPGCPPPRCTAAAAHAWQRQPVAAPVAQLHRTSAGARRHCGVHHRRDHGARLRNRKRDVKMNGRQHHGERPSPSGSIIKCRRTNYGRGRSVQPKAAAACSSCARGSACTRCRALPMTRNRHRQYDLTA